MKIALLHDYLNQLGGAERVLKVLGDVFPSAPVYTLLHDKERTSGQFAHRDLKTSFLDFGLARRHHRSFIPLMPLAASLLKSKESYDLIISSSAGYAKGFPVKANLHFCYCHSPLRYAWENYYLRTLPFAPKMLKSLGSFASGIFRQWDKNAASRVNVFFANSAFTAEKIRHFYKKDAEVIHPPVDTDIFYPDNSGAREEYFLMAGRIIYYKRFDLGVAVFQKLKKKLKIIGVGPELARLKKNADSRYVEFIPKATDDKLRQLYSGARALIFPQIEDFGLVAAEAQACGSPVIAYRAGGVLDIIKESKTGLFFDFQDASALFQAVVHFESMTFDRALVAQSAKRFSEESFKNKIVKIINSFGNFVPIDKNERSSNK